MNERLVSRRDREGELGQRKTQGALIGLFLCRPVSSRMFFGHHRCLDETSRHNSGWPEFSWVCEWCLSKPRWTTWRPGPQPQNLARLTQYCQHKRIKCPFYYFIQFFLKRCKYLLHKLDDILTAPLRDTLPLWYFRHEISRQIEIFLNVLQMCCQWRALQSPVWWRQKELPFAPTTQSYSNFHDYLSLFNRS